MRHKALVNYRPAETGSSGLGALLGLVFFLALVCGLYFVVDAYHRKQTSETAYAKQRIKDLAYLEFTKVNLQDYDLAPSHDRIISLDHRRYWEASGRVVNELPGLDVKTVVVRFYAVDVDGKQSDTTDVTLHNIGGGETRAFRQTLYLQPPSTAPWTYGAEVVAVEFTDGVRYPQD